MTKRLNNMKVQFDGNGYINNRGTSKYWGVADDHQSATKKWRITVNGKDGAGNLKTHTMYFQGFSPSEETTASIAACFYQFRRTDELSKHAVVTLNVNGKKYIARPNMGSITMGTLPTQSTKLHIDFNDVKPIQAPVAAVKKPVGKIDKSGLSIEERILINNLTEAYKNNELSQEGARLISQITETMAS